MTCKDCKYFAGTGTRNGTTYINSGECLSPKFHRGYCYEAPEPFVEEPDAVLVEDDEGWGIFVGRDFGCIHFKAK